MDLNDSSDDGNEKQNKGEAIFHCRPLDSPQLQLPAKVCSDDDDDDADDADGWWPAARVPLLPSDRALLVLSCFRSAEVFSDGGPASKM